MSETVATQTVRISLAQLWQVFAGFATIVGFCAWCGFEFSQMIIVRLDVMDSRVTNVEGQVKDVHNYIFGQSHQKTQGD